jgi:hypothetical protein
MERKVEARIELAYLGEESRIATVRFDSFAIELPRSPGEIVIMLHAEGRYPDRLSLSEDAATRLMFAMFQAMRNGPCLTRKGDVDEDGEQD